MARHEYYPEYYLKKRQRDAVFNRVWKSVIVIAIVALGAVAGYLLYKQLVEPRRQPSDNSTALAGLKGDLEAQERINSAANQGLRDDVGQATEQLAQETKLSEIAYVQSFPQIHVSVAGSNQPVNRGEGRADSGGDEAPSSEQGEESSSKPAEEAKSPAAGGGEESSAGAKAAKTDEAKKPVDDKEAKPAEAKPAAAKREYKIYAGSYPSQENADEGKRGLSALGLTGTIIKNGADYNLLVGTLTDFDAALALRNKLKGSGYGNSFVTRVTR